MLVGNSENILDQKYALGEYILLLTSLKNTGLSSGKIRITFWIAIIEHVSNKKKRAPFLLSTPV